jgi:nucleoside-diphosphate-sugar epimerase
MRETVGRLSLCGARSFDTDIRDFAALTKVFEEVKPDAVIHCAGLKARTRSSLAFAPTLELSRQGPRHRPAHVTPQAPLRPSANQ